MSVCQYVPHVSDVSHVYDVPQLLNLDDADALFSKHQQRQNKKKVSRAYPDLMHVSDRVSLVAVSQRARKDPLEGTPKRKKVVRCM